VLRGKKNFARPREKRKKHTFLREKKRFSVKEKCRATKKEKVIVALHPSERIIDFDDDDDEDFFSSFPQKFIPHHNKRAFKKRERKRTNKTHSSTCPRCRSRPRAPRCARSSRPVSFRCAQKTFLIRELVISVFCE
jgi:hypothetical protein